MTDALRRAVRRRAKGRCEYCRMPVRLDQFRPAVDHIVAQQHAGPTTIDNLALSCAHCNGHKGPNVSGVDPVTGDLARLFNPRVGRWRDHFEWSGAVLVGRTATGRVTTYVLAINATDRTDLRRALMAEGRF